MTQLESARRVATFESIRNRDYRWFWLARLAGSASMQMGTVAHGWLVYQLTGSALALGWVSSARSLARLLLSLYGGALADRVRKREVLIWARAAMLANVLALGALIFTDTIRVWHLIAYSFMSGVISALMMPAQKAYLAQLVNRETLLNAVALTFASMGLMGIVGAALAGYAIDWWGAETVYFIIAIFYCGALWALSRLPPDAVRDRGDVSLMEDLREGVHYVKSKPLILSLLALVVVRVVLGWSHTTLMPVYATEVLQLGARGLGLLSAAPGAGSLLGSLGLASLGDFQGKGKMLLLSGVVMGVSLVGFSKAQHLVAAFIYLLLPLP